MVLKCYNYWQCIDTEIEKRLGSKVGANELGIAYANTVMDNELHILISNSHPAYLWFYVYANFSSLHKGHNDTFPSFVDIGALVVINMCLISCQVKFVQYSVIW